MLAAAILLSSLALQDGLVLEVTGRDASLRVVRAQHRLHTEFTMKDASGRRYVVAVSTSHPAVRLTTPYFRSMTGLGLRHVSVFNRRVMMSGELFDYEITVPESGTAFKILVRGLPGASDTALRDA
ncbi:MAG: hypothetical protein IH945_10070, partial [Armatimonadetes bacterium]|nr:hypothetical protein [Armatimonadota bacterium]